MQVARRCWRTLGPLLACLSFLALGCPEATAAALTSVSLTPGDPTANSSSGTSYTLSLSGASATTARCIAVRFEGNDGTVPAPSSPVWQFQGGSTTDGTKITLNQAGQNFIGSIATYRAGIPAEGFHATFDGYMAGGGADGMTFSFLDPDAYGGFAGGNGGGLGYVGLTGIAVAMDTFQNTYDPSSNFIGIANGGTGSDVNYVATNTSVPSLRTTHTYDITYNSGVLVVKIDNVQYLSQAIAVPARFIPAFTAGTGGSSDEHSVTNVVMTYKGGGASGTSPAMPGGMIVNSASATLTGSTAVTAGNWGTPSQNQDRLAWTYGAGQSISAGTLVINGIGHNPALAGTYYAQLSTYSDTLCSTPIDSATVAFAITSAVTVTVDVDPVLNFAVAGYNAGTCNGATIDVGSSAATSVSLGHITDVTTHVAGQTLSTTTNAPGGFTVNVRATGALTDSLGNTISNWTGTNANPTAFPGAGTSAFAYTTDHALSSAGAGATRFQTNKWAALSPTNAEIAYVAAGYVSDTTHVCYQVAASTSTKAGTYSTTVIYTAVPLY